MELWITTMIRQPNNCWMVDGIVNGKCFTEAIYNEAKDSLTIPINGRNPRLTTDERQKVTAEIRRLLAI